MDGIMHAVEALKGATDARLHLAMLRTPSTVQLRPLTIAFKVLYLSSEIRCPWCLFNLFLASQLVTDQQSSLVVDRCRWLTLAVSSLRRIGTRACPEWQPVAAVEHSRHLNSALRLSTMPIATTEATQLPSVA